MRTAYNALRAAVLTVAVGGAVFTMGGGFGPDANGGTTVRVGYTVEGMTGMAGFQPSVTLDTSQVEAR